MVVFPPATRSRLAEIEAAEGIPAVDLVHQAVEVWTTLSAEERRILGFAAMRLVADRLRAGGQRG